MIIPLTGCEGCSAPPDAPEFIILGILALPFVLPLLLAWAASVVAVLWWAGRR